MRQLSIWIFILLILFAGRVAAQEWLPVHGGMLLGVGGIVLINGEADPRQFLVVHDVKGRKVYAAKVTVAGGRLRYVPLDWIGFHEEPRDLEALTRIPGDHSFMALASKGIVYHIRLGQDEKGRERVEVLNEFWLPNPYN
ncbi:MAG: hypothetical protein ACE5LB_11565, partial [Acidiferrobacterales bacterium]